MTLSELQLLMKKSGIVGAGGAGFPSYAKLDMRADTIILNCAECEPLLKLHRQVLEQNVYEILSALSLVAEHINAENIVIGIKKEYKNALATLEAAVGDFKNIHIKTLQSFYPAGDEVVLIYETTGKVIKPGALPISENIIVFNVETMLNIYNAIKKDEAVTSKYVTVAGEVKKPSTFKVPIGITFGELIDKAGGEIVDNAVYIKGGPMMGCITNRHDTVIKTTNAVLVLPEDSPAVTRKLSDIKINMKRAMSACCQCRMCTDLCSRNLLGHPINPSEFMKSATSGTAENINPFVNTLFCSQCGICEMYACMQGLMPRMLIGEYKNRLRKNGIKAEPVFSNVKEEREYRKIPTSRLTARLGLLKYDVPAPISYETFEVKDVKILLSQHVGAKAMPVINSGDIVKKGQIIASVNDNELGACIHASINGKIKAVNETNIIITADSEG